MTGPPLPPLAPLALQSEVAAYLGVSIDTLGRWRLRGVGPRFVKVGQIRYVWAEVEAFRREREDRP